MNFKYLQKILILFPFFICGIGGFPANDATARGWDRIARCIGNQDAVLVADADNRIVYSKNADKKLIPASTLKVLTSLVALHYLGPDHRFITEFYLDENFNLKIKGYGDPLLVSEVLKEIAVGLQSALGKETARLQDLVLDDTYFVKPIRIPGITRSSTQPYDAVNGALCVNFNSIYFKRDKNNAKHYLSAEPQTPLLAGVIPRIKASGLKEGRIILSDTHDEQVLYAGQLFNYFFNDCDIILKGKIRTGTVDPKTDRLIFRHVSTFTLRDVVAGLLAYSNNFIANQLLLCSGAKAFTPPATLEKGLQAASLYARDHLGLQSLSIAEGSGLSRRNRFTAKQMLKILQAFTPCHTLMRHQGSEFYKTGTLNGISTRVGYFRDNDNGLYPFVVLMNTQGKSAETIARKMKSVLFQQRS